MGGLCCKDSRKSSDKSENVLEAEPNSPERPVDIVDIHIQEDDDTVLEVGKAEPEDPPVIEKPNVLSEDIKTLKPGDDNSFERMIEEDAELVQISPQQEEKTLIEPSSPKQMPEISLPPISISPDKSAEFQTEDPTELLPDLDEFQLIATDESAHGTRDSLCDTKSDNAENTEKLCDTPKTKDGDVSIHVDTESSDMPPRAAVRTSLENATPKQQETSDDPEAALAEYVHKREIIQDFYDANLKKLQYPLQSKSSIYDGIKILEDQFQRKRQVLQDYHDQEMEKIQCPVKKREAGQKLTMELLRIDHEEDTSRFRIIQNIMDFNA